MQVLIVATDIQTRGGIARYTWTLASALGGLIGGRNVHVLALVGKGGAGEIPEDFRILDVVTERLTLIAKIRFAGKALAQARHRYDLVVCTHLALAPIAGAIRLVYGSPYWVACHGTEAWRPLGPTKLLALRCADLVLPISRFTASMLHKVSRIPQSIMRVLYNAIPEGFTRMLASRQDAGTVRAERNGDSKWLLSVGSLSSGHSYKGFDVVIRALPEVLKAVPNLRYEIVGEGQDKERLKKLADEVGVGHKVDFTGEISDPELAVHYRTCDIFVLPSKTSQRNKTQWEGEGFGRVYVEAALAGKAVVGSRSGGAAEAVLDGKTGLLVDPSSVREVSEALLALLQDPVLAAKMGAEGCCWAQANFTIASMRKTLAELLAPYNGCSITEQGKRDSLRSPEPSRPNPEHLSDRWKGVQSCAF